jgi:SAM-dependent methyltransferase
MCRGVDLSEEMLRSASQLGLTVKRQDIFEALREAPTASLRVVSCFNIVEHFTRDDGFRLLQEIHRVVAPGGFVFVKVPNAYSPWGMGVTASDLTHEAAYMPATLIQIGRLAGFSRVEVREIGPAPTSATAAFRAMLWRVIRMMLQAWDRIETGGVRTPCYTRIVMARMER